MPTRRAVLAGLAATPIAARAAGAGVTFLPPPAMRADVALLRRAYGTLHPGLLRYDPATLDTRFDALDADAATPMSAAAFHLRLSRFLGTIRCGHSYANPSNQTDAIRQTLLEAEDRLPFHFLWLGPRMIVTGDPYGIGLAPGSEIVAIDDRPAAAILAALMPMARADGGNDGKRRRLLSVQGTDRWESFDVYFSLLFGRPRYHLTVEGLDGRRRQRTVDAVSLGRRRAGGGGAPAADALPWTLERRGSAALLTMPSWALYGGEWDWQAWLDEQVDRLIAERVTRLVVDLRANEGGMDCGLALAARLVAAPTPYEAALRLVRYRTAPADLVPHLDTWDRNFDTLGVEATRVDDRFYRLDPTDDPIGPVVPRGRRYPGEVRLLTGPQNSSATFQFAAFAKRAGLATLVGETTGGNRRGLNGGAFYFLRLPGSGIEVDLPLMGRFPTTPQPDAGIEPDMLVAATRQDIAAGRDAALERALG